MKYKKLAELYQALEKTSKRLEKTQYLAEFLKKAKKEDLKKIVLMIQGRVFPIWDERKTAVAARLAIKAINIATGKDIPAIEDEWKKTGDLGDVAKNFTKNKSQATLFSQDLTIDKVCKNLQKLPEAKGKGAVDRKDDQLRITKSTKRGIIEQNKLRNQ